MSWKSGSLDPRRSLPKRVSMLRKSANNPSLNGSILDDNSVVDVQKREVEWWKRLNTDSKNSSTDLFPISTRFINSAESEISQEESVAYQYGEVNFSTLSSLDLSSPKPLFKRREKTEKIKKVQNLEAVVPESHTSLDDRESVKEKKIFKHKLSEVRPTNYAQAISNPSNNMQDGSTFLDESEEDVQKEPKTSLFRKPASTMNRGKSIFTDAITNNEESEAIEHYSYEMPVEVVGQEFKKNLFANPTKINVERMSIFAEALLNESEPDESEVEYPSQHNVKSILSEAEKKQNLFKIAENKNTRKKSVFADAISNNSESRVSEIIDIPSHASHTSVLTDMTGALEKSQEVKRNLFKKAKAKNVGGKSIFAQALTINSELDTISDLTEPSMKKQKFSEDTVDVIDFVNIDDPPMESQVAEELENLNSVRKHRKSSLLKSRRQSVTDVISVMSVNSPMSVTSETVNFDKWKQLASSTMMESPKTPRRSERRISRNLLPVKSLMHSDIVEERENSAVSPIDVKKDSKVTEQTKDITIKEAIQPSSNVCTPSSPVNIDQSHKSGMNISNALTEGINNGKDKSKITRDNVSKSPIEDYPSEGDLEKMEDHPGAVRDARQSNVQQHSIEVGVLCAGSPDTEKFPQPHPLEISKRQSVGTWLKLQDSKEDSDPILSQSFIDRQVMEEVMAKRTNPPVRRSTYENVNVDHSVSNENLVVGGDVDINSLALNDNKNPSTNHKVRHSNILSDVEKSRCDTSATDNLEGVTDDILIEKTNQVRHSSINGKEQSLKDSPTTIRNVENVVKSITAESATGVDQNNAQVSEIASVNDSCRDDDVLSTNSNEEQNNFTSMEVDAISSDEESEIEGDAIQRSISQNNYETDDDDDSFSENIFTPKNDNDLTKNSQVGKNSTLLNLYKSTVVVTESNGSSDASKIEENKITSMHQDDIPNSTNKLQEDSTLADDLSEELFDRAHSLSSITQQSHSEKQDLCGIKFPILSEIPMEKTDANTEPPATKRLTKNVSSASNKENVQSTQMSQAELRTYLEKLQDDNAERKKKMEDFSKKFLTRTRILNLKSVSDKNTVKLKPKKKSVKKTVAMNVGNNDLEVPPNKKKDMSKPFMKEQWVTSYLCSFVEKKLEPSYGYKTKQRSEKFIKDLVQIVKTVEDAKENSDYHQYVATLKNQMARLKIVTTHFEFYRFIQQYLPFYFRIRSVPACGSSTVPKLKQGLFTNIIIDVEK